MTSAATLDIVPGASLGQWALGSRLHEVLAILRSEGHRDVNVAFAEQQASTGHLLITVKTPPLRLAFAGASQLLAYVELGVPAVHATYKNASLCIDTDHTLTLRAIAKLFGPTIAPIPHPAFGKDELLTVYAPGVAFGHARSSPSSVNRVIVFPQASAASFVAADIFANALSSPRKLDDGRLEDVSIKLGGDHAATSLTLSFAASASEPRREVELLLGLSTSEDVLCDLGAADQKVFKQDDRLRSLASGDDIEHAYFLVYFAHGLDFMLDATSHKLRKVVLHSNIPGADLFGRYARCQWSLTTSSGSTMSWSDDIGAAQRALSAASPSSSSSAARKAASGTTRSVPQQHEQPLVLDRAADSLDSLVIGRQTQLHGFPRVVLEVTEAGDIETCWLV